jgi:hypothetical protein
LNIYFNPNIPLLLFNKRENLEKAHTINTVSETK